MLKNYTVIITRLQFYQLFLLVHKFVHHGNGSFLHFTANSSIHMYGTQTREDLHIFSD